MAINRSICVAPSLNLNEPELGYYLLLVRNRDPVRIEYNLP